MLGSQVQVLLVALCSSVVLVQVGGAPRRTSLRETLRSEVANDQDVTRLLLLDLMSDLVAARGDETRHRLEIEEEEEEEEEEEAAARGRGEVKRRHLPVSQRERKAGCRNFFWKTFTSC